jgi:hypothetical protein
MIVEPYFTELDAIREEIGAAPTGEQGAVLQLAKERARVFLRTQPLSA